MGEIDIGENPTVIESDGNVTAKLWTKSGRRLYLNGFGPSSANRYIDLDAGTVEGGYSGGIDVDVDENAGTLAVVRRGDVLVVVDLDLGTDEDPDEDEDDRDEDENERDSPDMGAEAFGAESRKMATALAGDAAGRHGMPPNLPRESAVAGLEQSLDEPSGDEPLEVGDVFWNVTSVVGDGDGYHSVYLGTGRTGSLSSGLVSSSGDCQIRDELHTGKIKRASIRDLTDEERAKYDERMAGVETDE